MCVYTYQKEDYSNLGRREILVDNKKKWRIFRWEWEDKLI